MSTELITTRKEEILDLYTKGEALDPLVQAVRDTVESFEHDLSTVKGRKATASLAANVAKAKTFLDGLGKDLVSDWKAKAKTVDDVRKKMRDELDELKAKARAPLTELEAIEAADDQHLADIKSMRTLLAEESSSLYQERLDDLEGIVEAVKLKKGEAVTEGTETRIWLENAISRMIQVEMDRAELEELRREAEVMARIKETQEIEDKASGIPAFMDEAYGISEESMRPAPEDAPAPVYRAEANPKTEAKQALIDLGADEKLAVKIVIAIAQGSIPNMSFTPRRAR